MKATALFSRTLVCVTACTGMAASTLADTPTVTQGSDKNFAGDRVTFGQDMIVASERTDGTRIG